MFFLSLQYVNPAYERLLGYSSDELLGTDIRSLTRLDKSKHDVYDTINSHLKKGKVSRSVLLSIG